MKILVTGGGGFAMSHVARDFLINNAGAYAVVMDSAPLDDSAVSFFSTVLDRLEFVYADINHPDTWKNLDSHHDITHIVHGAAVTSIASRLDDLDTDSARREHVENAMATNIMGAVNIMGFALNQGKLQRVINISSGSVYGLEAPADPLPEDGYVQPVGFYATSKYCSELVANSYASEMNLPAINVRLSGVYGPMDRPTPGRDVRCAPCRIAHGALKGDKLRLNSTEAIGDFIYVGDVSSAIQALLGAQDLNYTEYNIAYGQAVSIRTILDITQQQVTELNWEVVNPDKADIFLDPLLSRGRFGPYSIDRVIADTGWHPRPIELCMKEYLAWLDTNPF